MPMRPRLILMGNPSYGIERSIEFAQIVIPMGLRRRIKVVVDDPRGVLSWQLVYNVLPGTLDTPVETDAGVLQSRADYLWQFFCARNGSSPRSFIITDLFDGKDYLVEFADSKLTYKMFAAKLFSSGLTLIQLDEPDVPTLEDGSLGSSENPDQI